ncbi:unnamed protein product [Strongylus vulgaris]|uniref:Neurotransmitter-gated ion-channel ligand-binding domain-containing protein n=1 Tax=Strongylus vulgaris TaxID=40348 RepID=A0A3P7LB20_STRVU|nr:unnamed protein product [Strongylus vulgaris]
MGPISDLTDTYSFNCYFRQMWTDSRLKFNGTQTKQSLSLSMAMLDKIWKPDTYFWNGARSYTHTMTTSNRLVRLYPDGTVLFSSRLTIKGNLILYFLKSKMCNVNEEISVGSTGSYAFGEDELLYDWGVRGTDRGVQMDYDGIKELAQFTMTGFQVFNSTNMTRDRITSVLTMVLIANDSKSDAPKTRRDGGRHSMYQRTRNISVKKQRLTQQSETSCEGGQLQTIEEFQQDNIGWRLYYWMMNNGRPTDPFGLAQNSISAVDQFSRIALPIYFVAVVLVYYNFYVNTPYDFRFDDEFVKSPVNNF